MGLVWGIKRQRQRHFPKLKSNLAIGKVAGLTQHWGIERQMERRSSTSWSGLLLLLERWYGQRRGKFSRTKISFVWKMIWGAHFSDYVKYTLSLHLLLLDVFSFHSWIIGSPWWRRSYKNVDKFELQKVILAHFTLNNSMWCLRRCLFSLKNDVRIEEAYLLRQLVLPWWKLIWSNIGESTDNWSTSSPIMETFTKKLGPILTFQYWGNYLNIWMNFANTLERKWNH